MDESIVRHLEQKVGTLKLSAIVRQLGYGDAHDYEQCVLGRAYAFVTGRSLIKDGYDEYERTGPGGYARAAAKALGVPKIAASEAERMCLSGRPASAIADWLESQGQ